MRAFSSFFLRILFYSSAVILFFVTPDYSVLLTWEFRYRSTQFFLRAAQDIFKSGGDYYEIHTREEFSEFLKALYVELPYTQEYADGGFMPFFDPSSFSGVCRGTSQKHDFAASFPVKEVGEIRGGEVDCVGWKNVTQVSVTAESSDFMGYVYRVHLGADIRGRVLVPLPLLTISRPSTLSFVQLGQIGLFTLSLLGIVFCMTYLWTRVAWLYFLKGIYKSIGGGVSGVLRTCIHLGTTPSILLWIAAGMRLVSSFFSGLALKNGESDSQKLTLDCALSFLSFLVCIRLLDCLRFTRWLWRMFAVIHAEVLPLLFVIPLLVSGISFTTSLYVTPHASTLPSDMQQLLGNLWMVLLTSVMGEPSPLQTMRLIHYSSESQVMWFAAVLLCIYHVMLVTIVVNIMIKVVMTAYDIAGMGDAHCDDEIEENMGNRKFKHWTTHRPIEGFNTRYFVDLFAVIDPKNFGPELLEATKEGEGGRRGEEGIELPILSQSQGAE